MGFRRVLVVAVLAGMVAAVLPAPPAHANHQYLWWNEEGATFRRFGANASVTIYQGALERACDFVNTAADVYVVPSGSATGQLTDVSGSPNTIITAASGGLFIEETIGFTAPSGTIPPGRYAVVYDECQDGAVTPGQDFVLDPAFEVVFNGNPPDINPRIAQLKADAGEEAAFWSLLLLTVEGIEELQELKGTIECLAGGLAGCAVSQLTDHLKEQVEGFLMDSLGVTDPVEGARKEVNNLISHYGGIHADPPDPDYRQPNVLTAVTALEPGTDEPLRAAEVALGNTIATEGRIAEALLHAIERYQGADAAGDLTWALVHAREAKALAGALEAQLLRTDTALDDVAQALLDDDTDHDGLAAFAEPNRQRIADEGFDAEEQQVLRSLDLDKTEVAALRASIAALDFGDYTESRFLQELSDLRDLGDFVRPHLATLQTDLQDMVDFMLAAPELQAHPPLAEAGGPYTVAEGATTTLDASGSTDADSPIASYDWDLDRDGAFDDATGATPAFAPPAAFTGLVSVRVTDATGLASVDVAEVAVTEVNAPPTLAVAPDGPQEQVTVGDTATFTATTTDADGDPVTVRWRVDDAAPVEGPTFSYTPAAGDVGQHVLRAEATDGRPDGGTAVASLGLQVRHPDADGDGWSAVEDCDDGDPDVHPGRKEVVGNGIDDDCDPATGDGGSPPTATIASSPSPAVAGSPVAFTTTAEDADGEIAAYAWDFGDGATSTEAAPAHTYAEAGTYAVALTVTDEQGDTATATAEVVVRAAPTAAFTFAPDLPRVGEGVAFTDASTDADGTVVGWAWDFGDGTTSTQTSPTHAYDRAGVFEVVLTATDDAGLTDTVMQAVRVAAGGTAAFTVAKGRNVLQLEDGATVVSATSAGPSTSQKPERAIDASGSTGWQTATGQTTDQRLVVAAAAPGVVGRLVLQGSGGTDGLRRFELAVSDTDTDDASFTTVATGTVPRDGASHAFDVPPVRVRFARLTVLDNHGHTGVATVRTFALHTRDRDGGVVSLLEGPRATVVDVTSEQPSTPAVNLLDGGPALWRTAPGNITDQAVTAALGGDGSHEVSAVLLTAGTGSDAVRDFEVRLSSTTADPAAFTTVASGTAARTPTPQRFTFPATEARFVQLVARTNYGHTSLLSAVDLAVLAPDGANVALGTAAGVGAAVVAATSGDGRQAIDFPGTGAWQTASGATTDQSFTVRLRDGDVRLVDRVDLSGPNSPHTVRRYRIEVSATTADPAAFTPVAEGVLPRDGRTHPVVFPPVPARYLRFVALDNHGGSVLILTQLRVISPQTGSATAAFDDLSVDADGDVVGWAWDFGDGATSSAQHPVHTYAAPGTYDVALTVTDDDGLTSTATSTYRVPPPPAASFTATPAAPDEGQSTAFADTSSSGGEPIVAWRWSGAGSDRTTSTFRHTFPDDGSYPVTLTVTDAQLQTATATAAVPVANVAPTVAAGADQRVVWGQAPAFAPALSDVGGVDRANLVCDWDFGDGTTARVSRCNTSNVRVAHPYADPGTYTATLTVTDPQGASASDALVVTVDRRATFPHIVSARSRAGGEVDVALKLYDTVRNTPLGGAPVALSLGSQTVPVVTDAAGEATATLRLEPGIEEVGAAYAGSTHHLPATTTKPVDAPFGDIVFVIDESGSMGPYIEAVKRNIVAIAQQLGSRIDFRLGLVGFGAGGGTTHRGTDVQGGAHTHLPYSEDIEATARALDELVISGGFEPGYSATVHAMGDGLGYQPSRGVCAVFIGDEPPQSNTTFAPEGKEDALAALQARDAVFFSISGSHAASRQGYGPDAGSLVADTGGAWFDIRTFDRSAEQVLDALLGQCITRVVAPDLGVTIAADAEEVAPGDQLTYTMTVTNDSSGNATGVALTGTVPAGATFVAASDGGTAAEGVVTWPLPDLRAGESATRQLTVRVDRPLDESVTSLRTRAEVGDDGSSGADRDLTDNVAELDTAVVPGQHPPVLNRIGDQTLDEGTERTIALAATDADGDALAFSADGLPAFATLTDAGDGSAVLRLAPGFDDAGATEVAITVSDGELTDAEALRITVVDVNRPPRPDAGGPYEGDEGSPLQLDATASTDPDGDVLAYAWDTDGDGVFDDATGATPRVVFDDDGLVVVEVRVSDPRGGSADALAGVRVHNVAPTAVLDDGGDVDEGQVITLRLEETADASAADTAAGFTYAFDCGDGSGFGPATSDASRTCPARDDAVLAVAGRVEDKDGGTTVVTAEVVVHNVAPSIDELRLGEALAGALAFDGGTVATDFTDPGVDDTHVATYELPDGRHVLDPATSGQQRTFAVPQLGCGLAVAVEVRDDDGGVDTASTTLDAGSGKFLPPLREDGTAHATRRGQVVPVKVRITDCQGERRADLRPAIRVRPGDGVNDGGELTGEAHTPATTAASQEHGVMRWTGAQYLYDLDAELAPGRWTILVYPFGKAAAGAPTLRHLLEVR